MDGLASNMVISTMHKTHAFICKMDKNFNLHDFGFHISFENNDEIAIYI